MAKVKCYRKEIGEKFFPYYFGKIKNIFYYIVYIIKNLFNRGDLLHATGSHIITGYPGSGKTLMASHLINSVDNSKYFFYTNIDEFHQENVKVIKLDELFNDKKQARKLATRDDKGRYLYGLILDEINLNFNRRINRTADYTNLFIGLIEMVVTHRHQHIPRLYFIGQKLELQDGQLISLFQYQHDIIKTKKRYRYWKYYDDKAQRIPVKIKYITRLKDNADTFQDFEKSKVKINWLDLKAYNTFGMASQYAKLKEYSGEKSSEIVIQT